MDAPLFPGLNDSQYFKRVYDENGVKIYAALDYFRGLYDFGLLFSGIGLTTKPTNDIYNIL